MKPGQIAFSLLFLLAATLPPASTQTVSGLITGTVVDPAGADVVGATVQLFNDVTKQVREFKTVLNGTFIFPELVPGAYTLRIAQPGFKTYQQNAITVSAQERVDLHEIKLSVGEVSTTVEVQAEAVHV